jgi:hypothetical protein
MESTEKHRGARSRLAGTYRSIEDYVLKSVEPPAYALPKQAYTTIWAATITPYRLRSTVEIEGRAYSLTLLSS